MSLWDTSEPWGFDYREEQVKILGPVRSLDFFWTNQAVLVIGVVVAFETQVNVVVGAVRDPGRFLDWADVVLLVRKNKIGEVLGIVSSKAKSQAALLG